MTKKIFTFLFCLSSFFIFNKTINAQIYLIKGKVVSEGNPIHGVHIQSDAKSLFTTTNQNGEFELKYKSSGVHSVVFTALGYKPLQKGIFIDGKNTFFQIEMVKDTSQLSLVEVSALKENQDLRRMPDFNRNGIFSAKKNDVILIENLEINSAANTARQLFAKVPGVNIQENDAAGIQMAVSARGLNPNRSIEFNFRQNGHDISADPLGYPESYYTPFLFFVNSVEVVRGAASLQFGPQFGGMINFKMNKGNQFKPIEGKIQATYGSFGFMNLNASIGGSKGKFNYYFGFGRKQGKGWRKNSDFWADQGFMHTDFQISKKVNIGLEYTYSRNNQHLAGGLTDQDFVLNPQMSSRERNWMDLYWHMISNTIDIQISDKLSLNIRNFATIADRNSTGYLNPITQADAGGTRTLLMDKYRNVGSEMRLMYQYKLLKNTSALVAGVRTYRGHTDRMQGSGVVGKDAIYALADPSSGYDLNFSFPSWNVALFAENMFKLHKKFSITPGIRAEYIATAANGYYKSGTTQIMDSRSRERSFVLAGLGLSYKPHELLEVYGNFSQNYSAVNFNDIRVNNPSLKVDPNIKDVNGYNADLGFRGNISNVFKFDVSGYYLAYNDKLGTLSLLDENQNSYQYRTNVSDSRNLGAELFFEFDLMNALKKSNSLGNLSVYFSGSYTDAKYVHSKNTAIEGKQVEFAPNYIARSGIKYKVHGFSTQLQYAYTSFQFSDANNSESSNNGASGKIPEFTVVDLSISYDFKKVKISGGCNNLLNRHYFTRRSSGYPGPGLIPSDLRNFYLTLTVNF